jgi:pyridoxal biosynthesis lyase PdxS
MDLVFQEKSQTLDEILRRIMHGAALIRNKRGSIQKATRAVLKRAYLRIVNTAGHFEQ